MAGVDSVGVELGHELGQLAELVLGQAGWEGQVVGGSGFVGLLMLFGHCGGLGFLHCSIWRERERERAKRGGDSGDKGVDLFIQAWGIVE